ncbi:TPA: hypothetical protein OMU12_001019 [Enterobacter cloacae]|uniref:hypothetical protein n=1 Tax=Enterobacter cloacae TaxID=550 RepID=UPI000D355444|nr:hypothetical protein [Enterobacter cloacae]QCC92881.1 hypothetical protein E7735_18835 [Enterobacter cloacae]QCC97881.1 hypothetical protein E7739_18530 [Enterobacter cloacae]QCD10189.1 hypothetical protein E7729_06090 [Enterobacter cloacae]HCR1073657.1 hypothetical protein [Enterobacter cloacae]
MKIKFLAGLGGALVGGALAVFYYSGGAFKRDVLVCSTEFNFTRNEGRTSEVKVNTVAQFYFHRDGTGLTTYKGAARAGGQNLIVDRDVEFTWKQRDDDKVIVLSYTKTWRRHNDNTPDTQWGSFASPTARYYLRISELSPSVWLIQDRHYPTYICRGE